MRRDHAPGKAVGKTAGPVAEITATEHTVLRRFALEGGRKWKALLRAAWEDGTWPPYISSEDAAALQCIRNRRGSGWLERYTLAPEPLPAPLPPVPFEAPEHKAARRFVNDVAAALHYRDNCAEDFTEALFNEQTTGDHLVRFIAECIAVREVLEPPAVVASEQARQPGATLGVVTALKAYIDSFDYRRPDESTAYAALRLLTMRAEKIRELTLHPPSQVTPDEAETEVISACRDLAALDAGFNAVHQNVNGAVWWTLRRKLEQRLVVAQAALLAAQRRST